MVKRVLRFLLWTLLAFLLLIIGGWWYARSHEQQLIERVVAEANKRLKTPVDVGNVALSWERFPNLSVKFSNLYSAGTLPEITDTLLALEEAFVEFNFWEIWSKEPVIKGLTLRNGVVNLAWDRYGDDNYHIWYADTAASGSASLQHFKAYGVDVRLHRPHEHFFLSGRTETVHWKHDDSHDQFSGELRLQRITQKNQDFRPEESGRFSFAYRPAEGGFILEDGRWDGNRWDADWSLKQTAEGLTVEATFPNLPADAARAWLPELGWTWKGKLPVQATYRSSLSLVTFRAQPQGLALQSDKVRMEELSGELSGEVNTAHPDRSVFDLERLEGNWKGAEVKVTGNVRGWSAPMLDLNFGYKGRLEGLASLLPEGSGFSLAGELDVSGHLKHSIPKGAKDASHWRSAGWSGKGELSKGTVNLADGGTPWKNITTAFSLQGNRLNISSLTLQVGSSDFYLSGSLTNLLPWALDSTQRLAVDARFRSQELRLEDLMRSGGTGNGPHLKLLDRIDLDLLTEVQHFRYRRFTARDISARFIALNGTAQARNLSCRVFGGSARGQFDLLPQGQAWRWNLDMDGEAWELAEVFRQLNNFGQNTLTNEQLSGTASLNLQLSTPVSAALEINPRYVKAVAKLNLSNGRLHQFKPMEQLSRFAEMEELKDVRFNTLTNTLEIKDGKVNIPEMDITTNVLNLQLMGVHGFDNSINYRVRLKLQDVIGKKKKKKSRELDEFIVEKERSGQPHLWVMVAGTVNNPEVGIDRELTGRSMGSEWKRQGEELREIFGKEGAPLTEEEKKQAQPGFIFEWEEADSTEKK